MKIDIRKNPTKLSKDRLYCFVFCVWTVMSARPISIPIFPPFESIKNGEIIIKTVPMYITTYLYSLLFLSFLFFLTSMYEFCCFKSNVCGNHWKLHISARLVNCVFKSWRRPWMGDKLGFRYLRYSWWTLAYDPNDTQFD